MNMSDDQIKKIFSDILEGQSGVNPHAAFVDPLSLMGSMDDFPGDPAGLLSGAVSGLQESGTSDSMRKSGRNKGADIPSGNREGTDFTGTVPDTFEMNPVSLLAGSETPEKGRLAGASHHNVLFDSMGELQNFISGIMCPLGSSPEKGGDRTFYFLHDSTAGGLQTVDSMFDVHLVRKDFPALHQKVHGNKQLVWLDNAATTHKPRSVIDATRVFYERDNSNIHRGAHALAARATDAYEGARGKICRYIGARQQREIIFVRGTTEGINLVAQSYGRKFIGRGDEIVVTEMEHHANIVPWQMLCEEKGAVLRVAPINDAGEILLDRYAALLTPRTKIVAFTQVSNVLGTVNPVEMMTQMAHASGARVLVDGAQSIPHFPVNVQAMDCDFFVFSGHKLFGPTGIGVLFGKAELLEAMPPWEGGGNMITSVSFDRTTYNELPHKFEAGTHNIAGAVGLGAAIDYVSTIDSQAAAHYEQGVLKYAMGALSEIKGLRFIGTAPGKVSVVSFVLEGYTNEEVGTFLDSEGIAVRASHHCAQPVLKHYGLQSSVRPSLAFYNTCDEIDALVEALFLLKSRKSGSPGL